MTKDIAPELLERINSSFEEKISKNSNIKRKLDDLSSKKVTHSDVYEFAVSVGEILSETYSEHLSSALLPDGRMYFNIAKRILTPTLKKNHALVADYFESVQFNLNQSAKIGIKAIKPRVDESRIQGFVNRISSEQIFDDVSWILNEPVITFSQSVVDDGIKENFELHSKSNLKAKIERTVHGHKPCDWCLGLAGSYTYPDVPDDVYKRHDRCRCVVEYDPGTGRRQNVHNKSWSEIRQNEIEERKRINRNIQANNHDVDLKEYKEIRRVLGKKAPVSFAKYQNMKYNNIEGYELLQDNLHVLKKIDSGEWGSKINPEKQELHMKSTVKEGASYFEDDVDVQKLFDEYAGTGKLETTLSGNKRNTEIINNVDIEAYINNSGIILKASGMKIHHSSNRTHIVPYRGMN